MNQVTFLLKIPFSHVSLSEKLEAERLDDDDDDDDDVVIIFWIFISLLKFDGPTLLNQLWAATALKY